jgi:impB/mucB/samB family C-terminal domain
MIVSSRPMRADLRLAAHECAVVLDPEPQRERGGLVRSHTVTRQLRLPVPTTEAPALADGAAELMRRHWARRPLRLIGLRARHLTTAEQPAQLPLPAPAAPSD